MSTTAIELAPTEPAGLPRSRRERLRPHAPLLAGLIAALAVAYQLFGGRLIGLADNADGARLACQLGVDARVPPGGTRYFGYVITSWDRSAQAARACPHWGQVRYPSSETPLLRAAEWLSGLLGFHATLDLRALGLLCVVAFGIAVGLLVRVTPGPLKLRLALAAGVILVAGDATFSAYFISLYSEPAGFLGLLLLCAAWLWVPSHPALRALSTVLIALAGAVIVVDKSQTAPLAFVLMAGLLWRRTGLPSRRGRFVVKGCAVACSAVLLLTFVGYERIQPRDTGPYNAYGAIFTTLLGHTKDPAADLRWLGLPTELARYAGTGYWDKDSAVNTGDPYYYHQFLHWHLSYPKLLELYLTHPVQAAGLYHRMTYDAGLLKPDYLGTSTYQPGVKPEVQTSRFGVFAELVSATRAWDWFLLPALWLWALWAGLALTRRRRDDAPWRAFGELIVVLVALSVVSFGVVALGGGDPEGVKHLVTADLSTGLLVPFGITAAWTLRRRRTDGTWRPGRVAERVGRFLTAPPLEDGAVRAVRRTKPAPVPRRRG